MPAHTHAGKRVSVTAELATVLGLYQPPCTQDPDLFFPTEGETAPEKRVREVQATALCRKCDHQLECLEVTLPDPSAQGILGGRTEKERAKMRRKTPSI